MLIGVGILFTFGLKFFVPMDILWRALKPRIPKKKQNIYQNLLRAGCVLTLAIIAAAVPNIDLFIGLLGAIFLSLLGELSLISHESSFGNQIIFLLQICLGLFVPALIDTIFRYPNDLGVANWILIKNLILMLVSLLVLISGSVASIDRILNELR